MNNKNENQPAPSMLCPWWLCFTFDNPLRRIIHNPNRILKPYIKAGWKAIDVGPGMGYFTIPLAKLVGARGQVIAADLQTQMLDAIKRRAVKAGLQDRIRLLQTAADSIGLNEPIDFALAFWMVHEVPNQPHLIAEIAGNLKPGGLFLLVEPRLHVSGAAFAKTVKIAQDAGLVVIEKPRVAISNAVLLQKK